MEAAALASAHASAMRVAAQLARDDATLGATLAARDGASVLLSLSQPSPRALFQIAASLPAPDGGGASLPMSDGRVLLRGHALHPTTLPTLPTVALPRSRRSDGPHLAGSLFARLVSAPDAPPPPPPHEPRARDEHTLYGTDDEPALYSRRRPPPRVRVPAARDNETLHGAKRRLARAAAAATVGALGAPMPSGFRLLMPLMAAGRALSGLDGDDGDDGDGGGGAGSALAATRTRAVVLRCWRTAYAQRAAERAFDAYTASRGILAVVRNWRDAAVRSSDERERAGTSVAYEHTRRVLVSVVAAWREQQRAFAAKEAGSGGGDRTRDLAGDRARDLTCDRTRDRRLSAAALLTCRRRPSV
jgi:hypothetical protein